MECIFGSLVMAQIFIEKSLRQRAMSSRLSALYYLDSSVHLHTKETVLEASQWDLDICSGRTGHVDQIGQGHLFVFLVGLYRAR